MLFSSLIFLFVFLPIVLILYHVVCGHSILAKNIGSVKNVGVEDTPRISEPLSFFEKTLFSSAPTGVSHR